MKISFQQIQRVLKVYKEKQGQEVNRKKTENLSRSDRISLSPAARKIQEKIKVDGIEPVRRELVDSLKKEIKEGRYNISGRKVAEKMLYRSLVDKCCDD